jgi:hypothetical protein
MSPTSGEIEREMLRKKREIVIPDMSVCYYCKSTGLREEDKFCPNCGFPQQGTQQEMQGFLIKIKHKNELLAEQKKKINRARNYLYALAALYLVVGVFISFYSENQVAVIIVYVFVSAIFFGLALWCRTNPFAAILSGFFVYIILNVISAVYDPSSIVKGIPLKFLVISAFIYGYKSVKDSEKLGAELESLKTSTDLNSTDEVPAMPAGEQE